MAQTLQIIKRLRKRPYTKSKCRRYELCLSL